MTRHQAISLELTAPRIDAGVLVVVSILIPLLGVAILSL
jgi:hypothetical protein